MTQTTTIPERDGCPEMYALERVAEMTNGDPARQSAWIAPRDPDFGKAWAWEAWTNVHDTGEETCATGEADSLNEALACVQAVWASSPRCTLNEHVPVPRVRRPWYWAD